MSLTKLLLMYWIDADNDTIHLDPKTTPISSSSSNLDVVSADSLQEDVRLLSDRSPSYKSSPTEVLDFASTKVRESREESPTVESDMVEAP